MLTHLDIKDFTLIKEVHLEFRPQMTVITGETGAGKSMILDALDLVLGGRAETQFIRTGAERCEISATFALEHIPEATAWLQHQEIENTSECIIRRTFTLQGRTRNLINGTPVTVQQLKELTPLLIQIHAQHSQQRLLNRDEQRRRLDHYGRYSELLTAVSEAFQACSVLQKEIDQLKLPTQDHDAQLTLLRYQAQELEELDLQAQEYEQLGHEHQQLSTVHDRQHACDRILAALTESEHTAVIPALYQMEHDLRDLITFDSALQPNNELLQSSLIQLQELQSDLQHYRDRIHLDPERLNFVEQRLEKIHQLARKHHLKPTELTEQTRVLKKRLNQLEHYDEHLQALEQKLNLALQRYDTSAHQLTQARKKAAKTLAEAVTQKIHLLGMPKGQFKIDITPGSRSAFGSDSVEFQVTANPGQPLQALQKVASGGELSRISLAIHVITAESESTPTLVFDEVDVGIGGGTAAIVGKLLRELGATSQILCITHLPQVASQGHHHLHIEKKHTENTTQTELHFLSEVERVQEIARMLGGVKVTEKTIDHAKEMLMEQ